MSTENPSRNFLCGADELAVQRCPQLAVTDQTNRIDTGFDAAVEHRIIGENRSDADHDAAQTLAGFLHMQASLFTGHPLGISGIRGNTSVQCHRVFHHDKWGLGRNIMEEHLVDGVAFFFQNAGHTGDTGVAQDAQSLACNERIGIQAADNDAGNFVLQNGVCARRRASPVTAWLQCDIDRRAGAVLGTVFEGVALCM